MQNGGVREAAAGRLFLVFFLWGWGLAIRFAMLLLLHLAGRFRQLTILLFLGAPAA